ncbi:MAG TPA: DUF1080 domain-containing protein [Opitutaceae bacterium]|nr:DUF1080 domain-containing protein [Opitutaceae bacterium]
MTTSWPRLAAFVLALSAGASLHAGPWQPLFNGKDLTGWRVINGTAPYTVEDGMIVGTTKVGSPNSFLGTEQVFGNFILELELKEDGGPSNSGVQFRGLSNAEYMNHRVHGYQCEIDPGSRAWSGGIYDEARRGWLYPVTLNPAARTAYNDGGWNVIRIEAIGDSLRTWINGVPVAHVIDGMTREGFIALQLHSISSAAQAGRRVLFRNLRIQTTELTPAPVDPIFVRNFTPNQVSAVEKAVGWRPLWDGATTEGWRAANREKFPSAAWKIENGELIAAGNGSTDIERPEGPGDIVTTERFAAFEFQCEFKLPPGAKGAIKYYVQEEPDAGTFSPRGLQYQLLDDEKHPDAAKGTAGNHTHASLYDLIARDKMPSGGAIAPKAGEWQHARIVARPNGQVEHWLNGVKVVEFDRHSAAFAELVAKSKYAALEKFGRAEKGPILLQDHGYEVRFRSLKIRELK